MNLYVNGCSYTHGLQRLGRIGSHESQIVPFRFLAWYATTREFDKVVNPHGVAQAIKELFQELLTIKHPTNS